jgi:hypothetical protein
MEYFYLLDRRDNLEDMLHKYWEYFDKEIDVKKNNSL